MAKRVTAEQIADNMTRKTESYIKLKDILVDLSLKPGETETTNRLRIVGVPIQFDIVNNKIFDPDTKKTSIVAFPDSELNPSPVRICEDDPAECPWTKMGYKRQKRYAVNVIDRSDDKVKVLSRGSMIFEPISKEERRNKEDNIELLEQGEKPLWTMAGGREAPDIKIKTIADNKALGGVKYEVYFNRSSNTITDEEIEQLKAIHEPTDEEIKIIRKSNPEFKDREKYPDWLFYGYDLDKLFAPTQVKYNSTEDTEEVDVSPKESDEDEDPFENTKKTNKTKKVSEDDDDEDISLGDKPKSSDNDEDKDDEDEESGDYWT